MDDAAAPNPWDGPIETLDGAELEAYFALMETATLLQYAVDQHLREAGGLSYVQFQILARLRMSETGTLRMTDIADRLVFSRSGLTYQVGQLVDRGLLTRSPCPDDERSTLVTLTDAGAHLVQDLFPKHVALTRERFFDGLARGDVETLGDILGRARDWLRRTPPRSATTGRNRRRPYSS